jgi:hypothetical protein
MTVNFIKLNEDAFYVYFIQMWNILSCVPEDSCVGQSI